MAMTQQMIVTKIPITALAGCDLLFVNEKQAEEWHSMGVYAVQILHLKAPFVGHPTILDGDVGMDYKMRNAFHFQVGTVMDVKLLTVVPNPPEKTPEQCYNEALLFYDLWMAEKRLMFPELPEEKFLDEKYDDWISPTSPYLPYFSKIRNELRQQLK